MQVSARLNADRWLADCPDKDCNSAGVLSPYQPGYMCGLCRNKANGYKPHQVIWPSNLQEIVETVSVRNVLHRNWRPGEDIPTLRLETAAYHRPKQEAT